MQMVPHGDQSGPRLILVKKPRFTHCLTKFLGLHSYPTDIELVTGKRRGLKTHCYPASQDGSILTCFGAGTGPPPARHHAIDRVQPVSVVHRGSRGLCMGWTSGLSQWALAVCGKAQTETCDASKVAATIARSTIRRWDARSTGSSIDFRESPPFAADLRGALLPQSWSRLTA
jgi:hypothetical protein